MFYVLCKGDLVNLKYSHVLALIFSTCTLPNKMEIKVLESMVCCFWVPVIGLLYVYKSHSTWSAMTNEIEGKASFWTQIVYRNHVILLFNLYLHQPNCAYVFKILHYGLGLC